MNHTQPNNKYLDMHTQLEVACIVRTNEIANIYNQLQPFKLFGMPAQNGLTASILTATASFYSIIFSQSTTTNQLFSAALGVVRR